MTFAPTSPPTHGVVVPLPLRRRGCAEAIIVPIADAVAAIMFDEPSRRPTTGRG